MQPLAPRAFVSEYATLSLVFVSKRDEVPACIANDISSLASTCNSCIHIHASESSKPLVKWSLLALTEERVSGERMIVHPVMTMTVRFIYLADTSVFDSNRWLNSSSHSEFLVAAFISLHWNARLQVW